MAEFTHLSAAQTSPNFGWLTLFSHASKWSQVELTPTAWTIRGAATSGLSGWTVTVTSVNAFSSDASGVPTGLVGGIDVRDPAGVLVVTIRGLSDLSLQARDMVQDVSRLFAGNDVFTGSSGDDLFYGGRGVDTINGGAGDDHLWAQSGIVDGGPGADRFYGSGLAPSAAETGVVLSNVETVDGTVITAGDPVGATINIAPSATGFTIGGGNGADFITGGSGPDTITTTWGADTIRPGLGDDYIDAGNPYSSLGSVVFGVPHYMHTADTAKDTLDFSTATQGVTVNLALTTAQDTGVGVKTLLNFEQLRGSAFNDTLSGPSYVITGIGYTPSNLPTGPITIYGGAGDDRITGDVGNDLLMGEEGNDILDGRGGANTLDGGAGFDIVDYTSRNSAVSITLGASSQPTGDTFISIEGVIGSAFADTLSSSTAAGGSGFLAGGAGDDQIYASQYGDVLQGGAGNDTLSGGSGADKFVLQLDGSVDTLFGVQGAQGDSLLLLDSQGAIVSGANGLFILDTATGRLSWDADSDAGPMAPVVIAQLQAQSFNPEFRSIFAAGFQPSAFRSLSSDGRSSAVVYDWGNAAFEHTTTIYRSGGAPERFDIFFDNGSKSNKFWDFNNTETWATRIADYDAQGRMTAYSVEYDDGSRQVFQYDLGNTRPWERLVESYDALGRLSAQGIKNDDGTASERYVDTYDTQPWAYYIDNYDALGRLLNHTFYNANGTVFG